MHSIVPAIWRIAPIPLGGCSDQNGVVESARPLGLVLLEHSVWGSNCLISLETSLLKMLMKMALPYGASLKSRRCFIQNCAPVSILETWSIFIADVPLSCFQTSWGLVLIEKRT